MINKLHSTIIYLASILFIGIFIGPSRAYSQSEVIIRWDSSPIKGEISISNGKLDKLTAPKGRGNVKGCRFELTQDVGLTLTMDAVKLGYGPEPTVVHVKSNRGSFSFFLRDIKSDFPIYIPEYGAIVLPKGDNRSFGEVENQIRARDSRTKIQAIEALKEMSFDEAATTTRNMSVPIWLGISRDMRMFEVTEELEDTGKEGKIIRPMYSTTSVKIPGTSQQAYIYALGRGLGVKNNISRSLDMGNMPIYHSEMNDDDVKYHSISFVSFADKALTQLSNNGTNYVVSDKHSQGRRFKAEHEQEANKLMESAYEFDDDMVFYVRTTIENTGSVPRYAWIKTPRPGTGWWHNNTHKYDRLTGFSSLENGSVFCVSKLNGDALPNEEVSILLQPGEKVEYEFFLPHLPISKEKATLLRDKDYDRKLKEARAYWKSKLVTAADIKLPEKRIENMLKAGLLHLDLVTFGQEPFGTVSANIGVYTPIGTESSPIIQFYLSMGWFDLAKRSLNYFLDTQLSNGYIQNYEGYTVETGAALWTMGEYYRYTRDIEWIKRSLPKIIKSCDYLIQWRDRNKIDSLRGRGYGLIDGKVADPEDHYHQFMLNGYAYLGLSRIAEVLEEIDPEQSKRLLKVAQDWKYDLLETVRNSLAKSPVVPLGDGRWVPTLPPWAEADGPRALFMKSESYWSHGTFTAADALLGPMYLVFCEIISTDSKEAKILLDYHSELFYQENSAISQPYYSKHNWLQAKLGMTKPFLNTYYNTLSAHADRQTFTFWEHMYRVSPHKTHEEAGFLMETRWMLYQEDGEILSFFKTIPREWFKSGGNIELNNVKSYFGNLKIKAESLANASIIQTSIELDSSRMPKKLHVRLPHPNNLYPKKVIGGVYDKDTETVIVDVTNEKIDIKLEY